MGGRKPKLTSKNMCLFTQRNLLSRTISVSGWKQDFSIASHLKKVKNRSVQEAPQAGKSEISFHYRNMTMKEKARLPWQIQTGGKASPIRNVTSMHRAIESKGQPGKEQICAQVDWERPQQPSWCGPEAIPCTVFWVCFWARSQNNMGTALPLALVQKHTATLSIKLKLEVKKYSLPSCMPVWDFSS